jgi:hypothetical protein
MSSTQSLKEAPSNTGQHLQLSLHAKPEGPQLFCVDTGALTAPEALWLSQACRRALH